MSIYPKFPPSLTGLPGLSHPLSPSFPIENVEEVHLNNDLITPQSSSRATSSSGPTQSPLNRLEILFQRKCNFSITLFFQAHCACLSQEEEVIL